LKSDSLQELETLINLEIDELEEAEWELESIQTIQNNRCEYIATLVFYEVEK
jgi:hypothetical protein